MKLVLGLSFCWLVALLVVSVLVVAAHGLIYMAAISFGGLLFEVTCQSWMPAICLSAWSDNNDQSRAGLPLSLMVLLLVAAFEARAASRRCSCASRNAAEMLSVRSVIDWRFQLLQAQGLMLSKRGL